MYFYAFYICCGGHCGTGGNVERTLESEEGGRDRVFAVAAGR